MDGDERERLRHARRTGPHVAWRDVPGALMLRGLEPAVAVTVGRSTANTIALDHVFLSRRHAEIVLRVIRVVGEPDSVSVVVCDLQSKHGTESRPLKVGYDDTPAGPLSAVPTVGARPFQLDAGDHDVRLAREVWIRVGGVPVDPAITQSRKPDAATPTPRQRDVLVELCRSRFGPGGRFVPTPSNAEIATRLTPPIGAARVSDLISEMYRKYQLDGTKEQNRFALVEFALDRDLVGHEDYL
jgi:hypothetical protein